ncbi:MAG: tRNA (adenosine(37)-N6)-dimethylallyltransferase MiaA [Verrucomicrobiales bacterium]|nr:tRNA (adenosine(37)-N6)-dimethylallyltransferase MiaA [Verrucomicrobiales bacterium]
MNGSTIYLTGATASGKSALAMYLAKRLGGEIISVDSMQVYCGLNIGTAKPNAEEQAEVQHHLIDVAQLSQAFDAAQFIRLAERASKSISSRGRIPIFCGGTGLYFRALMEGLGDSPPSDESLRNELSLMPLESLVMELKVKDPEAAKHIDLKNPRRVLRAIEVIRLTGRPYSDQRIGWENLDSAPQNLFCINREVDILNQRIHKRVDEMFDNGLVEETQILIKQGLRDNRNACQALGYRQVLDLLDGKLSLENVIDRVKTKTRQFAKRQRSWFRNQMKCEVLEWPDGENVNSCCERLLGRIS